MRYVHAGPTVTRAAHVRTGRASTARCLVEVCLPGWPCERYRLGMLELEDTAAAAKLLVESFQLPFADDQAAATSATAAAVAAPTPPTMPRDMLGLPMWPPPPLLDPVALARWHVSFKGLHWRVNTRLQTPTLERSLQSSLVLAVQARDTSELVACAELSLRPADGSLPGEFAPPAILLVDRKVGHAYVSNLAVHGEHRRRRLASRLLSACEDTAAARWRCREIYLHVSNRKCAAPPASRARLTRARCPSRPPSRPPSRSWCRTRSVAARGMYDRVGYRPLPNFEQPTSAGGVTNLYFRKPLDAQGPCAPASPGANGACVEAR